MALAGIVGYGGERKVETMICMVFVAPRVIVCRLVGKKRKSSGVSAAILASNSTNERTSFIFESVYRLIKGVIYLWHADSRFAFRDLLSSPENR